MIGGNIVKKLISLLLITITVISSIVVGSVSADAKKKKKTNIGKANVYCYATNDVVTETQLSDETAHYFPISYTSKAVKPSIKLEYNSRTLKKGKDFKISAIKKVKGAGNYKKVTVKGKGRFKGKTTVYYGILPKTKCDVYIKENLGFLSMDPSAKMNCFWKTTKGTTRIYVSVVNGSNKVLKLFGNTIPQNMYSSRNIIKHSKKFNKGKYKGKGYKVYSKTKRPCWIDSPHVTVKTETKTWWLYRVDEDLFNLGDIKKYVVKE